MTQRMVYVFAIVVVIVSIVQAQSKTCPDPRLINTFKPQVKTYDPVDVLVFGPQTSQSWCVLNPDLASRNHPPCSLHHVYLPNSAMPFRDPLLVFMPGTNMVPDKQDLVLSMAAYAGYRTIGLSYDNRTAVEICDSSLCGEDCHGQMREEAILGIDRSNLIVIEKADSVLERLYALLVGLHEEDMADGTNDYGWDNYYVPLNSAPELTFNNIIWNRIVVAGFSQGAGHAARIAKEAVVEGLVIMDGANDTCVVGGNQSQPADWILDLVDASANRPRFGIRHAHGEIPPYVTSDTWLALGLGISGMDDLDDGVMNYPPFNAAVSAQRAVSDDPDCGQHKSMARDGCMPTTPFSQTPSNKPEKIHLYSEYLLRFCFATGPIVNP